MEFVQTGNELELELVEWSRKRRGEGGVKIYICSELENLDYDE